jgi:ribosome-associated protein
MEQSGLKKTPPKPMIQKERHEPFASQATLSEVLPRQQRSSSLIRRGPSFPEAFAEGGHLSSVALPLPVSLGSTAPSSKNRRPLPDALTRASLAARIAVENKATDVVVLDLRGLTPEFDFFVIATGASRRQVHTIVEEVDAKLTKLGDTRLAISGYVSSKWVVQDYGDVLVHVFDADTRDYYRLEENWADAKKVDWE